MVTKLKPTDKKFSKKTYNPISKLTTEEIDKKGWNVKKTFIDPKTAQEILNERNSNPIDRVPEYTNRNLKKRGKKTDLLIRDIKANNFFPSLIKFDAGGQVLDGQHRLYAIAQAGKTVKMMVETGADRKSMIKVDRGCPRSIKDILGLSVFQEWGLDPKYWTHAATLGKAFFSYIEALKMKGSLIGNLTSFSPTDEDLFDFFNRERKLIEWSAGTAKALRGRPKLHGRVFMIPLMFLRKIDAKLAEAFLYDLQSNSSDKNPAVWVASYLAKQEGMNSRAEYIFHSKKVFGAMQAHIDGKNIVRKPKELTKLERGK